MYQMLPQQRARNITGIVYEKDARQATGRFETKPHGDDWYDDLVAYMASLKVPCAVSPIHKDPYDWDAVKQWIERHSDPKTMELKPEYKDKVPCVGDDRPAHVHIVFSFPGAKSRKQMTEYMWDYCPIRETMWQEVKNLDAMIRYLCHLDCNDPAKVKYDIRKVYGFGGLDLSALEKTNAITKLRTLYEITEYIEKNGMRYYSQLVRWAVGTGDTEIFACVSSRAAYFGALFKGKAQERKDHEEAEQREKQTTEDDDE